MESQLIQCQFYLHYKSDYYLYKNIDCEQHDRLHLQTDIHSDHRIESADNIAQSPRRTHTHDT